MLSTVKQVKNLEQSRGKTLTHEVEIRRENENESGKKINKGDTMASDKSFNGLFFSFSRGKEMCESGKIVFIHI